MTDTTEGRLADTPTDELLPALKALLRAKGRQYAFPGEEAGSDAALLVGLLQARETARLADAVESVATELAALASAPGG